MNRMSVFHILCLVSHLLHVAVFAQETGRKQVLQLGSKTDAKPIYNTETKTEGFLSPQQSLEALKLPEGFSATLFAAEPDIQQPIAATTDALSVALPVDVETPLVANPPIARAAQLE